MMRALLLLLAAASMLGAANPPKFEQQVLPIFTTYCFTCHGQSSAKLGLDLRTAGTALRGSFNGPVIVPGKPDESLLWKKVSARQMPPAIYGQKIPDADLETIKAWIAAGAPSDAPAGELAKEAELQRARFDREVHPVLKARCVSCHGGAKPAAGLAVDSMAAVLKGAANGPVVVEGYSQKSALIRRVTNKTMPPPQAGAPLSEKEIRAIGEWIDRGNFGEATAHAMDREFTPLEAPPITAKQRQFWAFRKPVAATPPANVKAAARVRTPVDRFLLAKLEAAGFSYSPDAPAQKLLRRAYLDLTGLPPTPAQAEEFLRDSARPGAYERLIDKLLDSPHYGERWGRHWLDAMGYVDTTGKDFQPDKPDFAEGMWRYRDYVIRAFNRDTPWNQFLTEQIAGDELIDWRAARGEYTPRMIELLTATGYLRNILDITHEDISNLPVERYEALFKLADTVGGSALGLTVGCARCHSHKFDPIPQRDYYRLIAVFKGAFDTYDWIAPAFNDNPDRKVLDFGYRSLPYVEPGMNPLKHAEQANLRKALNEELDGQIKAVQDSLRKKAEPLRARLIEKRLAALPADLHEDLRRMLSTPVKERDALQKYLAGKFGAMLEVDPKELNKLDPDYRRAAEESSRRVATLEARKLPDPLVRALWDRGEPSPTFILQRGEPFIPGRQVGPGVPAVLTDGKTTFEVRPPWPGARKTGRRLALARWLIEPDHPLTARVIVNRIWKHHFGEGIVKTLGDFGKMGVQPSHPELLDWLARQFQKQGWSLKAMHRLMMTSSTYRQSSKVTADHEKQDPANALWSRMPLQRMDAEALYDSLLAISKRLDETPFGLADPVTAREDGLATPVESENGWRRGIYLRQNPKNFQAVFSLFEAFDYPQMSPNCVERGESTVATQALHLLNDAMVARLAASLAGRVRAEAGADPGQQIEQAYLISVNRPPTPEEKALSRDTLRQLSMAWASEGESGASAKALETFCHTLINSSAFIYVD